MTFEAALTRLEQVVAALERGDLPLEESLRLFEEGVALSRRCHELLQAAEGKVEVLLAEGAQPLETGGDE